MRRRNRPSASLSFVNSSVNKIHDLYTTMASPPSTPRGFLDLPQELRDEIYQYVLIKDHAVITLLSNEDCKSQISAAQPPICYVSKQIRSEALPIFYRSNNFAAELADDEDLETLQNWFATIGKQNVKDLRVLSLSACTTSKIDGSFRRCSARCTIDSSSGRITIDIDKHTSRYGERETPPELALVDGAAEMKRALLENGERMEMALEKAVAITRGVNVPCLALMIVARKFHELLTNN